MENRTSCFFSISVFPHPWAGLGLCRFMGFLQALTLHTLHTLGQFLSCFCISICYCGYKSEIKLREKKRCLQEKRPLSSAQEWQSNGRVGLGREEQIPALVQPRRKEQPAKGQPLHCPGIWREKKPDHSPAACSGHWSGSGHTCPHHSPTPATVHNKVLLFDVFSLSLQFLKALGMIFPIWAKALQSPLKKIFIISKKY